MPARLGANRWRRVLGKAAITRVYARVVQQRDHQAVQQRRDDQRHKAQPDQQRYGAPAMQLGDRARHGDEQQEREGFRLGRERVPQDWIADRLDQPGATCLTPIARPSSPYRRR